MQGEGLLHIAHAGAQALPGALLELPQQLLLCRADGRAEGGIAQGGAQAHVVPVFEGEGDLPGLHESGGAAAGVLAPGALADELAPHALQLALQAEVDRILRGGGPGGKGGIQLGLGAHHGLSGFLNAGFFRQGHTGHRPCRGALHQQQARQQQRYETAQHVRTDAGEGYTSSSSPRSSAMSPLGEACMDSRVLIFLSSSSGYSVPMMTA